MTESMKMASIWTDAETAKLQKILSHIPRQNVTSFSVLMSFSSWWQQAITAGSRHASMIMTDRIQSREAKPSCIMSPIYPNKTRQNNVISTRQRHSRCQIKNNVMRDGFREKYLLITVCAFCRWFCHVQLKYQQILRMFLSLVGDVIVMLLKSQSYEMKYLISSAF